MQLVADVQRQLEVITVERIPWLGGGGATRCGARCSCESSHSLTGHRAAGRAGDDGSISSGAATAKQISGWLVDEFPDDPEMRVSHETIYLSLFVQ